MFFGDDKLARLMAYTSNSIRAMLDFTDTLMASSVTLSEYAPSRKWELNDDFIIWALSDSNSEHNL